MSLNICSCLKHADDLSNQKVELAGGQIGLVVSCDNPNSLPENPCGCNGVFLKNTPSNNDFYTAWKVQHATLSAPAGIILRARSAALRAKTGNALNHRYVAQFHDKKEKDMFQALQDNSMVQ